MSSPFITLSPVIPTTDIERDIQFYEEKMGFKKTFDSTRYSEGPIIYAIMERDHLSFHLQFQYPQDMPNMNAMPQMRIQMSDIEPIYGEFRMNGLIEKPLTLTEWGTKEFGFYDPNGVAWFFYEDI